MKAKLLPLSALLLFVPTSLSITSRPAQASPGNFSQTCHGTVVTVEYFSSTAILMSTCGRLHGGSQVSSVDLNPIIANNNGMLIWHSPGNFVKTCTKAKVVAPNQLVALCKPVNPHQPYVSTSINLDAHITNIDGKLKVAPRR